MKILFALLSLLSLSIQATETNCYQFFDYNLSIELPVEVKQLSDSALSKRYGKHNQPPSSAFSNKGQTVSFTFTQYPTLVDKSTMNKVHKSISNMLRKSNENTQWKKDKIYKKLGTKIAVYEYETKSVGKYQYNLTYALPVNGKLTFISFITTNKKYKKKWVARARESMNSIQLTPTKQS